MIENERAGKKVLQETKGKCKSIIDAIEGIKPRRQKEVREKEYA